jgi:transposase
MGCQFDVNQKRLDIHIDFAKGSLFSCPVCGQTDCVVHDTEPKSWRHLNFFQHEAFLNARVPRIRCKKCGVRVINVPWAREGSGFTLLFEAYFMLMAPSMPVQRIAELVGEHARVCGGFSTTMSMRQEKRQIFPCQSSRSR